MCVLFVCVGSRALKDFVVEWQKRQQEHLEIHVNRRKSVLKSSRRSTVIDAPLMQQDELMMMTATTFDSVGPSTADYTGGGGGDNTREMSLMHAGFTNEQYDGDAQDRVRHGHGKYVYANGDVYVGTCSRHD